MRWDDLFADLEAQASTLERNERSAEVEERVRAESGRLRLQDRFRGNIENAVSLRCAGALTIHGSVRRCGPDWLLIDEDAGGEAVVALDLVQAVSGLDRLSAPPDSEGEVARRLGIRSALRRVARDRAAVQVHLRDGSVATGTLDRVGSDFVELTLHAAGEPRRSGEVRGMLTIAMAALVAVRRRL
jgi:hypothetical protein